MQWLSAAANAVLGSESDEEAEEEQAERLRQFREQQGPEPEPEPGQVSEPGQGQGSGSGPGQGLEPEPEPEPEPAQQQSEQQPEGAGTPGRDGGAYGWGFGEALSGLEQISQAAAQAGSAVAAQATELAKQAGADDIIDAYKRDIAEFTSVISDDAKTVAKEVDEAAVLAKERAAVLREHASAKANKAMASVDAATGGQLKKTLAEGTSDLVQVVQAVGTELGLSQSGGEPEAGDLLREAIAPLRVDRYGEMVRGLREDQATFAAAPADYAFIEWREARTRPDGSRLPYSPTEGDAREEAAKDAAVQRWLSELVPEVLTEEVFWDRYLFRLAAFEAAEAKRAALMRAAASPPAKGGHVSRGEDGDTSAAAALSAAVVGGDDEEELPAWSDEEDGEDEGGSLDAASPAAAQPEQSAVEGREAGAAREILKKLEHELQGAGDGDDSDLDGWGSTSSSDDEAATAPATAPGPASDAQALRQARVAALEHQTDGSDGSELSGWGSGGSESD